jgi:REP element-mobilizing transposase RayT
MSSPFDSLINIVQLICLSGNLELLMLYKFQGELERLLWQGRFALFPMDEPYLLSVAAYVKLNPIQAGMVKTL